MNADEYQSAAIDVATVPNNHVDDGEDTLPVTFVILTRDEERNLPGCLESLHGHSDDVHVLDSGSEDGTAAVATSYGVPVHFHSFESFGRQRNWAIDHIPHQYDWVFHLDADERLTKPLAEEIRRVLRGSPSAAGFYIPSKLLFRGQWLRRSGGYPNYQVRLFNRRRLRFEDHGHGQREKTDGHLGYLREPYLHDAFSKGLEVWLQKHAGYAKREAEKYTASTDAGIIGHLTHVFRWDPIARRRALKNLSFRLPCRSTLRFLDVFLLRGAFLDGRAGLAYAQMLAAYEAMISAHISVLRCDADAETESCGSDLGAFTDEPDSLPRNPR
ncbi:MAG: glycosyltransferase family 2 protein [Planctomycetaceae bacterium]